MQVPLYQQILSFIAAMVILFAYVGHQVKRVDSTRVFYNVCNAAGGAVLAWAALHPFQWGFFILESTWFVVSLLAFIRALRRVPSSQSDH